MKKLVVILALIGIFNSSLLASGLCKQAVHLAGGDSGFANGWCSSDTYSDTYWKCIISAIHNSGKKGYSNEDVPRVLGYANGWGSCS